MDEARQEAWFSGLADELAQALVDAGACAAACEELLEASRHLPEPGERQQLLAALAAPTAICSILIDLIDRPPQLVLAAAHLCRETSLAAAERLEVLAPQVDGAEAATALHRAAESCGRLLEAAEGL